MGRRSVCTILYGPPILLFPPWHPRQERYQGGENMADRDIGNKLLKFILSEEVRPFYVVEIYNVRT